MPLDRLLLLMPSFFQENDPCWFQPIQVLRYEGCIDEESGIETKFYWIVPPLPLQEAGLARQASSA